MARTKISEFSATPSDNTDIDGIDIAEGCAPSGINNAIRELMAQLKDMQTGASGDTFTLTTVNSTTVDTTNLEVTNLKAKDGTAAGSIANSTGVVTLGSSVLTTTDINGGTIDGTTIGASTPSTVVATQVDITGQGDLRLQDSTGGEYVALQAPATLASSYTLTLPADDGTSGQALITDGSGVLSWSSAASGDVYGPASATDNAVARYDGTTGKIIQNSAVTIADDGATVIAANSASDGLRITQIGAGNALVVEDSANPDATPTIIDATGKVVVGYTATVTMPTGDGGLYGAGLEVLGSGGVGSSLGAALYNNAAAGFGGALSLAKSNSATVGAHALVASGDLLGAIYFSGSDGTQFIRAAQITAQVDGTPGTNDMPGRLVFSTTADGASSPTERMRIDSAGNVGVGTTAQAFEKLVLAGTFPSGSANTRANVVRGTIPSSTTSLFNGFRTEPTTQAASFTLAAMTHFSANQGTLGAGSAVTNQYGFIAESNLTGATNNYGFLGNIPSGTGRWNFYAAGTADNYFAGNVGVGAVPSTFGKLVVGVAATASSTTNMLGMVQSSAVDAATLRLVGYRYTGPAQTAIDFIQNSGTNFQSQIAFSTDSGAGITERMRIDSAGRVGIGGAATTGEMFALRNTAETTATVYGFRNVSSINQATTTTAYGITDQTQILSPAALTNLFRFRAASGSFTGTVTNQYGFAADAGLTGATNNYGFHSNIATGTGRFNFFAAGTAANVFVGTTSIGGNPGAESLRGTLVASSVNYLNVRGAVTTASPSITAEGSDTNIDLTLTTKGTGVLRFGTYTAGILAQSGYITIKDAAGNTRNLLVG